jgi:hypothetical protein
MDIEGAGDRRNPQRNRNQPEQKNQVAADELARMAETRANKMRLKLQQYNPQLLKQLQDNPQLQQQLLTTIEIKDDYDDFVALLNQMKQMNINSGSGSIGSGSIGSGSIGSGMDTGSRGGKRRRTKRRRTLRRRTLRRRRY